MTIVGFQFTKIDIERKDKAAKNIGVKNNVQITDIRESTMVVGKEKIKTAIFSFLYESVYDPNVGHMRIKGDLVYMNEKKIIEDTLKGWKDGKEKKISSKVMAPVLNTVLNKTTILALMMSREVNLPAQVQLPKVNIAKDSKKKN